MFDFGLSCCLGVCILGSFCMSVSPCDYNSRPTGYKATKQLCSTSISYCASSLVLFFSSLLYSPLYSWLSTLCLPPTLHQLTCCLSHWLVFTLFFSVNFPSLPLMFPSFSFLSLPVSIHLLYALMLPCTYAPKYVFVRVCVTLLRW